MKTLNPLWCHEETSIFSIMTQKANAHKAINLAQGFPEADGPMVVKQAACDAIMNGQNQYAPAPGHLGLREALAKHQLAKTGYAYHPLTEITVFSGATEALFCAINALLEEGDELLTCEPFYDSYQAAVRNARAHLKTIPIRLPYEPLTETALKQGLSAKTKAILINSPHNPTGKVLQQSEWDAIAKVVLEQDLYLITDEVYEEIIFDQQKHIHGATLNGLRDRTITISSTSKSFSFTGWKIGYAFACEALTKAIRAIHQYTVFCSATPLQAGMVQAFSLEHDYYEHLKNEYQNKRDQLATYLEKAGFKVHIPQGTYFMLADYSKIAGDLNDLAFVDWYVQSCGVAAIPTSVFCLDSKKAATQTRLVRFAFCKHTKTLQEAGERMLAFSKKH